MNIEKQKSEQIESLLNALNKISQFSDVGDDFLAVVKMKSIAADAISDVSFTKQNKIVDAEGVQLKERDRVYYYDTFSSNHRRLYGILKKNVENPNVSEWYVSYDDGEDCAVLDFSVLWKAKYQPKVI